MSWPSGTSAVSGAVISSTTQNSFLSDLLSDLNDARPITAGGTGATTAAGARTNLGVSASDATITAIAALDFTTAGSMMYSTAADTFSLLTSTANGRAILSAANYAAMRTLLDLEAGTDFLAYSAFSANGISLVGAANYAAMRTLLDLEAGTDFYSLSSADSTFAKLAADNTFTANAFSFGNNDETLAITLNGTSGGNASHIYQSEGSNRFALGRGASDNGEHFDIYDYGSAGLAFRVNYNSGVVETPKGLAGRVATSSETSGTLTSASANRHLALTGNIQLDNSVFTAGDKNTGDPGTSNRTITRGSGVTMYVNGTNSATATAAANQMFGIHWRSASVCVLSGAVS